MPGMEHNTSDSPETHQRRGLAKGIYALPNAFTLAALFSAFYGIVMAINGRFDLATRAWTPA